MVMYMIKYPITVKQWKSLKDWSVDIGGQVFSFKYGFRKPWVSKTEAELEARKFAAAMTALQEKYREHSD